MPSLRQILEEFEAIVKFTCFFWGLGIGIVQTILSLFYRGTIDPLASIIGIIAFVYGSGLLEKIIAKLKSMH
jgi:hypothetical protein